MNRAHRDGFEFLWEKGREGRTLLLLHGTGGDEGDLIDIGGAVAPESSLISPRGRVQEGSVTRWFARHAPGVLDEEDIRRRAAEFAAFVPAALDEVGSAGGSVWALGYSNGANMIAALMLLYPRLLAGAVLLRPMYPNTPDTTPDLTDTMVFVAAGKRDEMIPGPSTEKLIGELKRYGASVDEHWVDGGHRLTPAEIDVAAAWFSRFHRE